MKKLSLIHYLLCGLGLLLFASLFGSRYCELLEFPAYFLRHALNFPITTETRNLPPSPDGRYQVKLITQQWTWHKPAIDCTTGIMVWRDGKPLLNGNWLHDMDIAHLLRFSPAQWLSNHVLAFKSHDENTRKIPLVVENATSRTLASVMIQYSYHSPAYLILEMSPSACAQFEGDEPKKYDTIICGIEPGKGSASRLIPGGTTSPPQSIKIRIGEGQPPVIDFDLQKPDKLQTASTADHHDHQASLKQGAPKHATANEAENSHTPCRRSYGHLHPRIAAAGLDAGSGGERVPVPQ